jgi:hypothetical protein
MDNEYRIQEENYLRTAGGNEALLSGIGLVLPAAGLARARAVVSRRQSVG